MRYIACISISLVFCSLSSALAREATGNRDEKNGERHFESLTVGALCFTNVWVHRQTNEVILIRHSMGIHSIRLSDLPSDQLEELKTQVGDIAEIQPAEKTAPHSGAFVQKLRAVFEAGSVRTKLVFGLVGFLFLMLIASKFLGRKSVESS